MDKIYSYYADMISQNDVKTKMFLTIYKNKTNFKGITNDTI